eukprot:4137315-Pyramimonas_sp.AAC.1
MAGAMLTSQSIAVMRPSVWVHSAKSAGVSQCLSSRRASFTKNKIHGMRMAPKRSGAERARVLVKAENEEKEEYRCELEFPVVCG